MAALVYLSLALVFSLLQEWIIFPGHNTQGQSHNVIHPAADSDLVPLQTAVGDRIHVLFGKAMNSDATIREDAATRPTLIFFYGNAMCLSDAVGFCRTWRKLGANVIGVEYPGYGMSSGKPGEKAFYAAADAAYEYAVKRGDLDTTKIIPVGLSIGTGVAVELASRKPVAGLVLLAPFTSLDDLARSLVPWLPVKHILRHHFRNEQKIAQLQMPILIAHGTQDTIIPAEMSRRLAKAAAKAQVRTVFIETNHNDMFELAGPELDAAFGQFIEQIATSSP